MTESWLSNKSENNRVVLGNMVPQGYSIIHTRRPQGKSGGVGIIYQDNLNVQQQKGETYTSFEYTEAILRTGNDSIRLSVIYHVGPTL